jgi:hypothetical protein
MEKLRNIAIILVAGIITGGCSLNKQTVIGSGDVEAMEVTLPAFDGVSVTGTCDVEIVIGETQVVEFYAQSEILDVLKYEVINGMLHIGFEPDYNVNTSKEIRAEITIPSLSFIGVTGEGNYNLEGAQQEILDIHISGAGDVEAFDMEVRVCNIRISGVGDCELNVVNTLDVNISGVGNIRYMGNPEVSTDVSGVGNVTAVSP